MSLTKQALLNFIKNAATEDGESDLDNRFLSAFDEAGQAALNYIYRRRDWTWNRTETRISTIPPYVTGTVAVTVGTPNVVGTGSTFPTTANDQFLVIAGEPGFHEVETRDNATDLTLKSDYSNEALTDHTASAFQLLFTKYQLPIGCRSVAQVLMMSDRATRMHLRKTTFETMKRFYATQSQASDRVDIPSTWSFHREADGTPWLTLFPAPDRAYNLNITYYREPSAFPDSLATAIDIPVALEQLYRTRVGIEMIDQGFQVDRGFHEMFQESWRTAVGDDAAEASTFEFDTHSDHPRNPSVSYLLGE